MTTTKTIRVKHPNGYEGILYGKSSMSIMKDGKEVFHTGFRNEDVNTEEDLYRQLEDIPELMDMPMNKKVDWDKIDEINKKMFEGE